MRLLLAALIVMFSAPTLGQGYAGGGAGGASLTDNNTFTGAQTFESHIAFSGALGSFTLDTFKIQDNGEDNNIILSTLTDVSAERTWRFNFGDANRTLTMTADASLNQNLLTTSAPTFASVKQSGSRISLAANFTNATTTFSNTALSLNVTSGSKYTFILRMFATDSSAAEGAKLDFNGGTATATDFRVHCTLFDSALLLSSQATALSTVFAVATVSGASMFECAGSLEPSGTGTFIVRAAQNSHVSGTLTVHRGSYLWIEEMP